MEKNVKLFSDFNTSIAEQVAKTCFFELPVKRLKKQRDRQLKLNGKIPAEKPQYLGLKKGNISFSKQDKTITIVRYSVIYFALLYAFNGSILLFCFWYLDEIVFVQKLDILFLKLGNFVDERIVSFIFRHHRSIFCISVLVALFYKLIVVLVGNILLSNNRFLFQKTEAMEQKFREKQANKVYRQPNQLDSILAFSIIMALCAPISFWLAFSFWKFFITSEFTQNEFICQYFGDLFDAIRFWIERNSPPPLPAPPPPPVQELRQKVQGRLVYYGESILLSVIIMIIGKRMGR